MGMHERRRDQGDPLAGRFVNQPQFRRVKQMDKDRIKGSAKQAKGAVKEAVGQVTGDAKTKAEGKTEKAPARYRTPSAA
jgi:uncharacterized protein YjbJ (UPF0337 family)